MQLVINSTEKIILKNFFFNLFIFGCAGSSRCEAFSLVAEHGLLIEVASLVAEHGF